MPAMKIRRPSGERTTGQAAPPSPVAAGLPCFAGAKACCNALPLSASHCHTIPALFTETIPRPSATKPSAPTPSASPTNRRSSLPDSRSQIRAVLSSAPVSAWRPSGERAAQFTAMFTCESEAFNSMRTLPVATSHTRALRSSDATSTLRPSGEMTMDFAAPM